MADINAIASGNFVYGAAFAQMPAGITDIASGTLSGRAKNYSSLPQPAIRENFGINYVDSSVFGSINDGSGTIVSANTSQKIFDAKAQRNFLLFINNSDTLMYVNIDAAASTTNSFPIYPQGQLSFEGGFIPSGQVNVRCAASGKSFIAKEG